MKGYRLPEPAVRGYFELRVLRIEARSKCNILWSMRQRPFDFRLYRKT